jgi:hypothetical protein
VPCGNRTRLISLEGWRLCRSAKGTIATAEGEGVEPSRHFWCSTVFETAAIASWLALPFLSQAAVAGVEPAIVSLTGSCLTVWPHRNRQVRTVGFEPTLSGSPTTAIRRGARRISRLSYVLNVNKQKRPAGVEPALPPWQGSRLPLHHGRFESLIELSKNRSTGWDSNPRRRITSAESSPLDDQCFFKCRVYQVGPEGLEPSPTWLRARHAASNTLIPLLVFPSAARKVGAEGVEPRAPPRLVVVAGPYKRPALTAELRAVNQARAVL